MLFNSFQFIFGFLPVSLFGFYMFAAVSGRLVAAGWLAATSLVFYCWDDPARLLAIISLSAAANFFIGRNLANSRSRLLLVAGISLNLIYLAIFKYAEFGIANLNSVFNLGIPEPRIALPIGISFFTFTQIAFLVDCFSGVAREYGKVHYALFVSFFPHLIAGPIIHHKSVMPQFESEEPYKFRLSRLSYGLTWFSIGLFKKIDLADPAGVYADAIFKLAKTEPLSLADSWIGAACYAFQIYFDFSGYSDMAIGLAALFGIALPVNFNSPYKSRSLIEFWRRWHITLSDFLRDYLYFSLGGNRKGEIRRYVNLITTMLLGGLWHGASWNFVIWGALHGFGLAINHLWRKTRLRIPNLVSWFLTIVFVLLAWVPFRAENLADTSRYWRAMIGNDVACVFAHRPGVWVLLFVLSLIAFWTPNSQQLFDLHDRSRMTWTPTAKWAVATGCLLGVALAGIASAPSYFLYFRF